VTSRRKALTAIAALMALRPPRVRGQAAPRPIRIGIVHPAAVEASAVYPALITGLNERGYVAGKNIALVLRSGHGEREALPGLIADLLRSDVDILLVVGPAATEAALAATRTVPIIAIDLESDPVRNGWVTSLARPGGNLTGFFLDLSGMSAKWLPLLGEVVPGARHVALLRDTASGPAQIAAARAAASAFSLQHQTVEIDNWNEFEAGVEAALRRGAQACVVLSSPSAFQQSGKFAAFALRHRVPAISPFRPFAAAGGLMSYGPDLDLFFRRTAFTIERILKGVKPADVAVEQPTKYEFVINQATAKALRVTLPHAFLLRADEVIR
jgi:putative ABC transport system substrate-binding protein